MSVTVPTNAEFTALKTSVTAVQTQATGLDTRLTADEAALQLLTARVVALEGAVVAPPPPPPMPPPPPPGPTPALVFSSEWPVTGPGTNTGTGAPRDTWDLYAEFNNGSGVTLMSVVAGSTVNLPFPGNALKVRQAGDPPGYAANLEKQGVITPGQDFWVRYYFRNDDTSGAGDHCTTCDFYQYQNLTYLRKMGGPTSWQYIKSMYGIPFGINNYPIAHWYLKNRLPNGGWFRLEDWVHWTSPTTIQVHPRVYDASGALLYQDADFQQSDYLQSGNLSWAGRADWTLASFYAAGYDFGVHPEYLAAFAIGNNGQQGATATGLSWYYAKVAISTVGWIGA